MMVSKLVKVDRSMWVSLVEYPDDTLLIEGIHQHRTELDTFVRAGIRFSREALKLMLPYIEEWLAEGETE
uniref:Uncharacterized protein n=1 Tax=viral metagenome TaxID=1070528 RepID=A0A6M3XLX8_9ZZZZ